MRYLSTRGMVRGIPFKQAVMMGLAEDGGALLLPESVRTSLPAISTPSPSWPTRNLPSRCWPASSTTSHQAT